MKQHLLLAFLVGWFFAYKAPYADVTGALFSTVIGPFQSKAQYEAEYDEAKDVLQKMNIPGLVMARCIERKEA